MTFASADESAEGGLDLRHGLEVIDVIHFYIQNDRGRGIEIEEGVHVLACLEDEEFVSADPVGVALIEHDRAAAHRRIEIGGRKYVGEHRRGCALSVHSGDPDALLVSAHEVSEIVRARYAGDGIFPGVGVFLVVGGNRHGVDEQIDILHVIRVAFIVYGDALVLESLGGFGGRAVVSADLMTAQMGYMGERAHAHSADPGEEDLLLSVEKGAYVFCTVVRIRQ